MKTITGNLVDIHSREIYPAILKIDKGCIVSIERCSKRFKNYIIPGFIDSHVHIESSMLTPQEFSKLIVPRGTIAIVTDPHEIANVNGVSGILSMLKNSKKAKCKMYFTIPSCVPATSLDGSGAVVSVSDIEILAASGNFVGLSEVMDVLSVVNNNPEMHAKLNAAKKHNLVIDGHAPLCTGDVLKSYVLSGISTDHETLGFDEAVEKINAGMMIQLRHGSAVDNYEDLKDLIKYHPDSVMFCTDDSHPDMLIKVGHIDKIVKRAIKDGYDIFDVLRAASLNVINHYSLQVGALRVSDPADFQVVKNLKSFEPVQVYISGKCCYDSTLNDNDEMCESSVVKMNLNKFKRVSVTKDELTRSIKADVTNPAIEVVSDQLVTKYYNFKLEESVENFESDIDNDILKLVYINRYSKNSTPQIAYIKGFGLKSGAIASTVAHDSHNIMAVGTNDRDLLKVINKVIEYKGGLAICDNGATSILPLPIGGIMSDRSGSYVNEHFSKIKAKAKRLGSALKDPFMTLSFMSLIVIPEVKLGERGLFDFGTFSFLEEKN